jgi:hypothetical protein
MVHLILHVEMKPAYARLTSSKEYAASGSVPGYSAVSRPVDENPFIYIAGRSSRHVKCLLV